MILILKLIKKYNNSKLVVRDNKPKCVTYKSYVTCKCVIKESNSSNNRFDLANLVFL